jgi:predicted acylesterase/phospholipase RssA
MVENGVSKNSIYADAARSCDIVMKGGITSGVVYPGAVCELARAYRFRNVGGTSAGAIAAAATAAAEYGRDDEGFERLEALPGWIGAKGNLPSLFQAQFWTRGLFKIVLAKVEHGTLWAVAVAVLRNLPAVLLGALPGLALIFLAGRGDGALTFAAYAGGGLLALLGGALALLAYLAVKLLWAVPGNDYGLCSGWTRRYEEKGKEGGPVPLTPWLYEKLNEYAGLPRDEPLTFGHLWAGPGKAPAAEPPPAEDRHVELAMMTTNLTNRRAHRLPFEGGGWYFRPSEFRRLFPKEVVDWMASHPPQEPPPDDVLLDEDLLPLPEAQLMPVIVPTRLSLSFPVLLSAVPLWRVDPSRRTTAPTEDEREAGKPAPLRPERCLFSDGGIASNFPIHFFDGLAPRRPTFAINLRPFRPGEEPSEIQRENSWMVACEEEKIEDWWHRPPKASLWPFKDKRLFEFVSGIGKTMQNRVDEAQMRVPGFRDRIAHVSMTKKEGGMNLSMEERTIEDLVERGRGAGQRLREAYAGTSRETTVTWESHRWTRLRSTLAVLEEMHGRFALGYESKADFLHGPTYEELVERGVGAPPPDFPWADQAQQQLGRDQIAAIRAAHEAKAKNGTSAETRAPHPLPEGRVAPRD